MRTHAEVLTMPKKTKGERAADALKRFVAEHGAPNTVAPGELSAYYTTLTPLEIGLSAWDATLRLNDAGYVVNYSNRRFHIHGLPTAEAR